MSPRAESVGAVQAARVVSLNGARHPGFAGRVGPNAIIQTRRVLAQHVAPREVERLLVDAGLGAYVPGDPVDMVDAGEVARFFAAIQAAYGAQEADVILREAGHLTGGYIIAHRIPRPAALVLRTLPGVWAAPLLLRAVAAHAWTFAGAGRVAIRCRTPLSIDITGNPLATPGCPWHLGVLESLFRTLASKTVSLCHVACCARGDSSCLTEIRLRSHA